MPEVYPQLQWFARLDVGKAHGERQRDTSLRLRDVVSNKLAQNVVGALSDFGGQDTSGRVVGSVRRVGVSLKCLVHGALDGRWVSLDGSLEAGEGSTSSHASGTSLVESVLSMQVVSTVGNELLAFEVMAVGKGSDGRQGEWKESGECELHSGAVGERGSGRLEMFDRGRAIPLCCGGLLYKPAKPPSLRRPTIDLKAAKILHLAAAVLLLYFNKRTPSSRISVSCEMARHVFRQSLRTLKI